METLLDVKNLTVGFGSPHKPVNILRDISFKVGKGEIVGIVGESGSGKSTLCAAAIRAVQGKPTVSGQVMFKGQSVYDLSKRRMRGLYGSQIAMVRQNPMSSMDPFWTVGSQLREVIKRRGAGGGDLNKAAIEALKRVRLTAPEVRMKQFPHQLSGGMLQRTLIAMATVSSPDLLIADEPTSALDASIRDEILVLFKDLRDRDGTAVMLVTHELEVIKRICDRVFVMYAGEIIEDGTVAEVFGDPKHPYTQALIKATPRIVGDEVVMTPIPGQVPLVGRTPPGCSFADRCEQRLDVCCDVRPPRGVFSPTSTSLCHLAERRSMERPCLQPTRVATGAA